MNYFFHNQTVNLTRQISVSKFLDKAILKLLFDTADLVLFLIKKWQVNANNLNPSMPNYNLINCKTFGLNFATLIQNYLQKN